MRHSSMWPNAAEENLHYRTKNRLNYFKRRKLLAYSAECVRLLKRRKPTMTKNWCLSTTNRSIDVAGTFIHPRRKHPDLQQLWSLVSYLHVFEKCTIIGLLFHAKNQSHRCLPNPYVTTLYRASVISLLWEAMEQHSGAKTRHRTRGGTDFPAKVDSAFTSQATVTCNSSIDGRLAWPP